MLKAVLLASCIIIGLPTAAAAQTAMPGSAPQTSVTVGVETDYVYERLAGTIPGPVANLGLSYDTSTGITIDAWVQTGRADFANEFDGTITVAKAFGNVETFVRAGVYLVRGTKPIYVVSTGASIPLSETTTFELQVDHYEVGFDETTLSGAVAGNIGPVTVSFGKAFNLTSGLDPLFATASIPLGNSGLELGFKGYWAGEDQGMSARIGYVF